MRFAVTGSRGLIGSALVGRLEREGHEVVRLGRPATDPPDPAVLEPVDAVVHLAGAGIGDRRWNPAYKELVRASRVDGTSALATALAQLPPPPTGRPGRTLVSVSAVGYYGADVGDRPLSEDSPPGTDFLARLCAEWEGAADPARAAGVRVVHPRLGLVLTAAGGVLGRMLGPFRLGLGGRLGPGRQYLSWISRHDAVSALVRVATDDSLSGPVNVTAPEPVTNAAMTAELGRALRRPAVMAVPAPALRLVFGREMADETLLASQRVLPARLQSAGFRFEHPDISTGLRAALADRRSTTA